MYIKKTKIDSNWNQYDKVVALSHLNNFGAIYCEIEHGTPIDNEYEVEQYVSEEKVAKRGMLLSEYIEQFGDITISPDDIDLMKKNFDEVQPMDGETYWYIDSCGGVTEDKWLATEGDLFRLSRRNVYQSKFDAQLALEMFNFCTERCLKYDIDFNQNGKWYISINGGRVIADFTVGVNYMIPFYYPSEKEALEVIEKYSRKDLLKFYGRV